MTRIHRFRTIEASWGVAVDLTAQLEDDSSSNSSATTVRFTDESVPELRQYYAELGVNAVKSSYPDYTRSLLGKALVIDGVDYIPTDFQEEGVACAVAGWLCEELGVEVNPLALEFDKTQNRYVLKQTTEA